MGTCGQPGNVFQDFCLKQGIDFINFCLKQGIFPQTGAHNPVLTRASDRVQQKMGNSAAFSREIMPQERSIMRQIMRFF